MDTRPARAEELEPVVDTLAHAFTNDPFFSWMFLDAARRHDGLRFVFTLMARQAARHGEIIIPAAGPGSGANAFFAPGRFPAPLGLFAFLTGARPGLPWRSLPRMLRGLAVLSRMEKLHYRGPHYYVQTLGVHPAQQGRGLGGVLLRAVLARADAEKLPAYLETAKEENLAFYGRYGFAVVDEIKSGPVPPVWTMLRPARSGAAG